MSAGAELELIEGEVIAQEEAASKPLGQPLFRDPEFQREMAHRSAIVRRRTKDEALTVHALGSKEKFMAEAGPRALEKLWKLAIKGKGDPKLLQWFAEFEYGKPTNRTETHSSLAITLVRPPRED
jgi:hypothetical protein